MPGWKMRALLGAATGLGWTALCAVATGPTLEMPLILASSLGFAGLLAWLGRRHLALNPVWAAGTVLLMPGFYYAAIRAGFAVSEATLDSLVVVGSVGGLAGAAMIWVWTAVASPRVATRSVMLTTLMTGTLAGGLVLPVAGALGGVPMLLMLNALWQGPMLAAVLAVPRPDG